MPDIDISWLAANPASQVLTDACEKLLPDSDRWLDYTSVAEKTAKSGSFNLITWLFRLRNDWTRNSILSSATRHMRYPSPLKKIPA
jgi:hypothetical protein